MQRGDDHLKTAASAALSGVQAKTVFGIGNVYELRREVAKAVEEHSSIRKQVDNIVNAKMKATLESSDVVFLDSDAYCESNSEVEMSNSSDESDIDVGQNENRLKPGKVNLPSNDSLLQVLLANKFNWVSFVAELVVSFNNVNTEILNNFTNKFFNDLLHKNNLISEHLKLVVESRQAYETIVSSERVPDGLVVTDSESDNPGDWVRIDVKNKDNENLKGNSGPK